MADLQNNQPVSAASQAPANETVELGFFELLDLIPSAIRLHLLSEATTAARQAIYDQSKLTPEERRIARDAEIDVFFGQIPVAEFGDALYSLLGWDDKREPDAALLSARIMGRLMLPASSYLGDVAGAIRAIGFDPAAFPQERIKFRVLAYEDAVKEIISLAGKSVPREMHGRVAPILDSFVRGVRVEDELVPALTKPSKIGGPGLSATEADAVVNAARQLSAEASYAEQVEEPSSAAAAPVVNTGSWTKKAIAEAYAGSEEERKRIEALQTEMRFASDAAGKSDPYRAFADAIIAEDQERPEALAVVAGALLLASDGKLFDSLKDERIRDAFRQHLSLAGLSESLARLDKDAADPALMEPFLIFLLKDRAALPESDAARFALRIGNALKKAKAPGPVISAAFDPEEGEFVWETEASV